MHHTYTATGEASIKMTSFYMLTFVADYICWLSVF